ncbi:uncharacterized mitochondrial protein AtMg00810-like [Capsicum annuum]|uniref:uncharacterized mitochondrial protein AtMg00810-like n=1 Tax=Capsicum annuum TaxID=4072 RepID=UPI001FB0B2EF|nr:uncharacterized mitochondrial protein AtMg00810-like [Capsicum annuum]
MVTVRCVIAVDVYKGWNLHQIDVHNEFLQGYLEEEVNMEMLGGFRRQGKHKVCKLTKSLYGFKQASRQWNLKLTYALIDTGLSGSKPSITPLESNSNITSIEYDQATGAQGDELLSDISSYQRLIGKLMYATIIRTDINFVVQTLNQFMQYPKSSHWEASIRVVRYLKGSVGQGILLKAEPTTTMACWCDSDWAACPNTRRLVTGYAIHFGDSLILWKSKKQHTVSRIFAEAEYKIMASTVAELTWLVGLFRNSIFLSPFLFQFIVTVI